MKRIAICLLVLALLCAGCAKVPASETTDPKAPPESTVSTPVGTDVPETTDAPGPVRLPLVAVSMPVVNEETTADDGTLIFTKTYQDLSLIAPDGEMAQKVVLNLLQQLDAGEVTSHGIAEQALNNYKTIEYWTPYFYQLLYNPMRVDEKVLSLYGLELYYTGGVHPNQVCVSGTYDMATGEVLTLKDILTGADAATALSQAVTEYLAENRETYQLYDGFATVIHQRIGGDGAAWRDNTAWYFSDAGLCFYFSPYDLAPYVVGPIRVEVPYESLVDLVHPDFLPAPLPEANGTVSVALAQDVELEQFGQFAEAILDAEGERFVLYADDLVTNVTLETGDFHDDGAFYPRSVVFMAHTLCQGDAVMVQAQITDTMPTLRLTFNSGSKEVVLYVVQSGSDGSMYLTDMKYR